MAYVHDGDAVELLIGRRTCDLQVVDSSPGWAPLLTAQWPCASYLHPCASVTNLVNLCAWCMCTCVYLYLFVLSFARSLLTVTAHGNSTNTLTDNKHQLCSSFRCKVDRFCHHTIRTRCDRKMLTCTQK